MQQKSPQVHHNRITTLSTAKIGTIMNSSAEVENVSKESAIVMSKAAELFIKYLSQKGYNETNNGRKLDYDHLADVVHSDSRFCFMKDIVPKKITVLEFKKLMAKRQAAQKKHQRDISPASSTSSSSSLSSSISGVSLSTSSGSSTSESLSSEGPFRENNDVEGQLLSPMDIDHSDNDDLDDDDDDDEP